ncbi:MAG: alanine--tRNA ligase [Patescibacteria group bacterium]|nr:alanine--tRNA ligase [Patescibacteria group bacterium]
MTAEELRKKYIKFFKEKGHQEIASASLVPENDPTTLFITAGMHPLVPYLMGEKHPKGKRLVSVQKCVRTVDIEDVGDSTHNTFFEMLGNWSLGDYFKQDSIKWSWEFLTDKKWLNISPEKIKVTVFEGDKDASRDDESVKIWQKCFKKSKISFEVYDNKKKNNKTARIFPLPKKDNWWGPAGETGPCGPDTEIFIDLGKPVNFEKCPNNNNCKPGCNCGRYIEIWNNVFMEYNRKFKIPNSEFQINSKSQIQNNKKYKYIALSQKNVDTGMGLERTLAILNGFDNVYEIELFKLIIQKIEHLTIRTLMHFETEEKEEYENSGTKYKDNPKAFRIIADHIRTSVFMISDGVIPSNLGRGYVLRRLIRRAIRYAKMIKIEESHFTFLIAKEIIKIYKDVYPELEKNRDFIQDCLVKEEHKFCQTLERGLKELKKIYGTVIRGVDPENLSKDMVIQNNIMRADGKKIFHIYETYGFPIEMSQEIMKEWGIAFDEETIEEAKKAFKEHQELSRTASVGMFKGGLADAGEQATKYHTATHLLLGSLRRILGNHIYQKGSNINADRLRFDFSHSEKLSEDEKQKIEYLVNKQIQKKLPINSEEMSLEKAKQLGAIGVFDSKYGDKVKVYTIGNPDNVFSREICNGPHVKNTSELGKFKIRKEQSSSAGVRRIKAILE